MSKTPWKKIVSDPNFLGEADFDEGEEKIVTIAGVKADVEVIGTEGKSRKSVVYFAEQGIKPMILNVARSKSIEKVTGSRYVEDWSGKQIQLYIDNNIKAFGDVVAAVRVRPRKPQPKQVPICSDCGKPIQAIGGSTPEYVAKYTQKKFGVCLCGECAGKRTTAAKQQEVASDAETHE